MRRYINLKQKLETWLNDIQQIQDMSFDLIDSSAIRDKYHNFKVREFHRLMDRLLKEIKHDVNNHPHVQ